jgi:hypothetical protein
VGNDYGLEPSQPQSAIGEAAAQWLQALESAFPRRRPAGRRAGDQLDAARGGTLSDHSRSTSIPVNRRLPIATGGRSLE